MPVYGYNPLKLDRFGGLNTLLDPTNLPVFASPDCQDVEFVPGLVRTRPGLTSQFAALSGNPTVNYLKTYITPAQSLRMLALDSLGILRKENPQGTLSTIGTIENAGVYGNSVSLFGREYLGFGDGKFGVSIPRQFDDVNLDRVSQTGPGIAPSATDESLSFTVAASPNGASMSGTVGIPAGGATEVGNIVTISFGGSLSPLSRVGDNVVIAGVGVGGYNGTFAIVSITLTPGQITYFNPTSGLAASGGGSADFQIAVITTTISHGMTIGQLVTTSGIAVAGYNVSRTAIRGLTGNPAQFDIYIGTTGLAGSGAGTVVTAGNIVAGVHQISVAFKTRQGYITAPAPPLKWTAGGLKRAVISGIPTGPPNVIARILIFTAAGGSSFFYLTGVPQIFSSNFVISDNTTTSVTVDFSDAVLLAGTPTDDFFRLVELGECSGVTEYSSRLFWWGERNKIQNFSNLTFDGGFSSGVPGPLPHFPLGWTQDPVFAAGGAQASVQGDPIVWGDAYSIVGNGTTATRGLITQSAFQDSLGTPLIQPATSYSVRARVARNATLVAGTFHINLQSTNGAFTTAGLSVTAAQAGLTYAEFTAELILKTQITGATPSDLMLQVYADGTPNQNGDFVVDSVEIFPTNEPFNVTTVRASKAEDPESYDGIDGLLTVAPENGQAVRTCFVIRDLLYIVKERSLYVTEDDGTNEPSFWTIREVSNKVGTLSVRGVGLGEEWAIIAGEEGVYLFTGGSPQKISQEIEPTWRGINWAFGHLIDVKVDIKRKRAYIAVPFGAATTPDRMLTLDFTEGFGDPQEDGSGRKWSPWLIPSKSMNLILRDDGTQQLFIGNNAANGLIYKLDDSAASDNGAAINSYWQSGYFQNGTRLNYGYVIANVVGSGSCALSLFKGDQSWLRILRGWTLGALGFRNMERQIQLDGSRMAVKFGTNGVGSKFSLQGFSMWVRESTWAPTRGINTI